MPRTKEFVKKRNTLLCKYFPEVMTVKTSEKSRDDIYEGLLMGYLCGQRDAVKGEKCKLFDNCYSIYDDRNYEPIGPEEAEYD